MKGNKFNFSPVSEINVTPLVDVMLVLLIIFMVTAPMMQQGVEVDLPTAKGKGFSKESRLVVSITRKKNIYVGKMGNIKLRDLPRRLAGGVAEEVLVKSDASVPYGYVIKVMAQIKKAGIEKVGLVTNPE